MSDDGGAGGGTHTLRRPRPVGELGISRYERCERCFDAADRNPEQGIRIKAYAEKINGLSEVCLRRPYAIQLKQIPYSRVCRCGRSLRKGQGSCGDRGGPRSDRNCPALGTNQQHRDV